MYSWGFSDILINAFVYGRFFWTRNLRRWSWGYLVVDPITFHRQFRVLRLLGFVRSTHRPMSHWSCWCWCCIDVEYVDVLREFIRAQSLGYFSPRQGQAMISCTDIDMCVLLQYVIVSICHFGSVFVRSRAGPRGSSEKYHQFHVPYATVIKYACLFSGTLFSNSCSQMQMFIYIYTKMTYCCVSVWRVYLCDIPIEGRHVEDALKVRVADSNTSFEVVPYGEPDVW